MKNKLLLFFLYLNSFYVVAQKFDDYKAFSSGSGVITSVKYNTDGSAFASGNSFGMVLLRDTKTGDITHLLKDHDKPIRAFTFTTNNQYLGSISDGGKVVVWDLLAEKLIFNSHDVHKPEKGLTYSFVKFGIDKKTIYYGGSSGKLFAVNMIEGGALKEIITYNDSFTSAAYTKDGTKLIVGSKQKALIIDLKKEKIERAIQVCSGNINSLQLLPDNQQFACLCDDGKIAIIATTSGKELQKWQATKADKYTQLAISPNGAYLVVGDVAKKPTVWNIGTYDLNSTLVGHQGNVQTVDFSPDSRYILTGSTDKMIKEWQWKKVFDNEDLPTPPLTFTDIPNLPTQPIFEPTPAITNEDLVASLQNVQLSYTSSNIPDSLGDRRITRSEKILVSEQFIEVDIWDAEYEDNDMISLNFNGEWILQKHVLTNTKERLRLKISPEKNNYFILYAHNEGERPPNTAALMVFDGEEKRTLKLSSDLKKCGILNFKTR